METKKMTSGAMNKSNFLFTMLFCFAVFLSFESKAQTLNVPVTGFNHDVVADGLGALGSASTTIPLDANDYVFVTNTFGPASTICASGATAYPSSLLVTSANTANNSGVTYQLQAPNVNNALRLAVTESGTLTLITPVKAAKLYLVAMSGEGAAVFSTTITFTDNSTQVISSTTAPDWCGGAAAQRLTSQIYFRASRNSATCSGGTCQYLFELPLIIDPTNHTKDIASITFTNTTAGKFFSVFAVGHQPICATPTAQASVLNLTPGVLSVNGSFTAANPTASKYLVVRTQGVALNATPVDGTVYTNGSTLGNGTIVATTNTTTFTDNTTQANTNYTYTIFSYNDACFGTPPLYNVLNPLVGSTTTGLPSTYVWNGSISNDYQIPGNWTPARTTADLSDMLVFNNGQIDTCINVINDNITRLSILNSTNVTFQSNVAATINIASDNDALTNELTISGGSSLTFNSSNTMILGFSGNGGTATIAGILQAKTDAGTVNQNRFNFTNSVTTVTATGELIAGGAVNSNGQVFTSTAANLFINGYYIHTFQVNGGSGIPTATWGVGSEVIISGYTTATGGPNGGMGTQNFHNFTYDCPNQTAVSQWSAEFPQNVFGTFTMLSSGTGSLAISNTQAFNKTISNFEQFDGIFDLATGTTGTQVSVLNISGNFNQTGGEFRMSRTTGTFTLNFNGTAAQTVNFYNAAPSGRITYQISNPLGINLIGNGTLLPNSPFAVNNGGGIRVSTSALTPVNTNLIIQYAATGTTLTYDGATGNITTDFIVWPGSDSPLNVTVNLTGAEPTNRLILNETKSVNGVLTLTNGVVQLNNHDLFIMNTATGGISIATPGSAKMITTNGTGQLYRNIATAATNYLFPIGDVTSIIEYSPVNLNFSGNTITRLVGVRVVDAKHPNDLSTTEYLTRYWLISDDGLSAATDYTGNVNYSAADIVGFGGLRLNNWDGTTWTQLPSNLGANQLSFAGNLSTTTIPLNGMQLTGREAVYNTYTWTGATDNTYQEATNWNPIRSNPAPTDLLIFNNGLSNTIIGVPTQTVSRVSVLNNTTVSLSSAATITYTLASDVNPGTNELFIESGSALLLNGASAFTLNFTGNGSTALVDGALEVSTTTGATNLNKVVFTNAITTVSSSGLLASGGTAGNQEVLTSTAANLIINGRYEHKYTSTSGSAIPTATWSVGSEAIISGYTTATGGPAGGGTAQTFYNFTYNCPNQTSVSNWSSQFAGTINGTFSIISTGTGTWSIANTQSETKNINNWEQTGGIIDLVTTTGNMTYNILGTFNQTGGEIKASATTGSATLQYNGTAVQNVNFHNAAPIGRINYRIMNPAGINLTGSGTLTNFAVNNGGSVRISVPLTNAINTTLNFEYAATGTTLTYDGLGSISVTPQVFPATSSPFNVTINIGAGNNLIVPFSRTIAGTLNMTSGDIDLGANNLTIGTATNATGTLTWSNGVINLTTGKLIRWFGATGLPTNPGNGVGYFPIASGGANRNVSMYFSAANALSTGGTIEVGHTNISGVTSGLSIADGAFTVETRTNSSWNITTGNGLTATGTYGVRATTASMFTTNNIADVRIVNATSALGAHVNGSGTAPNYFIQRSGLSDADLASGPFYAGTSASGFGTVYIATSTGNWSTPATWDSGVVPGANDIAFINSGVTVNIDPLVTTVKSLTINSGGTLSSTANTLNIDSILINNGFLTVNGGTINIGPANGGNRNFTNNSILTVQSGTFNINGNFLSNTGSTINQSGGDINVDGNVGGDPLLSVASGTAIVSLRTNNLNLTGGNLTIVDPHASTVNSNSLEYNTNTGNVAIQNTNHTFRFGNGISVDAGGSGIGFRYQPNVSTSRLALTNVIVNGPTGLNRHFTPNTTFGIMGNLTINNGGEFQTNGQLVYFNKNVTINTGGILTANSVMHFASYIGTTAGNATGGPQLVSGGGVLRNNATTPTANFTGLGVRNFEPVTLDLGNISFTANITFTAAGGPSRLVMANNSVLIENAGAGNNASATVGWIVGRYQKHATVGGINHDFRLGDLNYYTPTNIGGGLVTVEGDIVMGISIGDHPAISAANINPTKTVNRHFFIEGVNGIDFNNAMAIRFDWNPANLDAGVNTSSMNVGRFNNNAWAYPNVSARTANNITINQMGPNINGEYQVGEPCAATAITTQPLSEIVCQNASVTLSVVAEGSIASFQWLKNGVPISGATQSQLIINNTAAADTGFYTVEVTNACTFPVMVSNAAHISINTPVTFTTQPLTQAVCIGENLSLSANVEGGNLTYQWQKAGIDITGETSSSLNINAVSLTDAADYTLISTNVCGTVSSNIATVTVNALPTATATAAGNLTFCGGDSTLIEANTGTGLTYQWLFNGSAITGATNTNIYADSEGNYTVEVTDANTCSQVSNQIATVVNTVPTAITAATSTVFCSGDSVTLNAPVGATLSYQWKLNGNNITNATNASFTALNSGDYTVTVTNSSNNCVATSSAITVSANTTPSAVVSPAGSVSVCQGAALTLSANVVTGLSYQWKLNGADIPNATGNTFSATQAGDYTVFVSAGNNCTTLSATTTLSLNPLPTATITPAASATICQGASVVLNANTGTGLTYQWKLNGGNISGANNASYTANAAGDYTVQVTNANTCSQTSSVQTVTVNALPTATATAAGATTFCQGNSVVLNANTGTGLTYQWKLNGGNINGATNAAYTANAAGSYTVEVTNANTCSQVSNALTVTVNPLPTSVITPAGSTTYCTGGSVVLNANTGTGLTYQWRRDGINLTGATNNSYIATVAGDYTLIVTNANTCSATSTVVPVTINPLPTATATAASSTTFCLGGSVVINANTGTNLNYQWKLNGGDISGATSSSYTANAQGSYTVLVTNSATGCFQTSSAVTVVVNPLPTATATAAGATTFCQGGNVIINANTGTGFTYQWQLNNGNISGATSANYTANAAGDYRVIVTNSGSCSATSTVVSVTVNPLPVSAITANSPLTFCDGGSTLLEGNTGTGLTYQWLLNGNNISGATSANYTADSTGAYTLQVTNTNTCVQVSAATNVVVNPNPDAIITNAGSNTICDGDSVTLDANLGTGLVYQWLLNGANIVGANNANLVVYASGHYSLQVSDANSCQNTSDSVEVIVNPLPIAVITANGATTICANDSVSLVASLGFGNTYQWALDGVDIPGATNEIYFADESGSYTVFVTNSFGCSQLSTAIVVTVLPLPNPVVTQDFMEVTTGTFVSYQWYLNGVIIPGAMNQSYTVTENGNYTVVVTDNNGCSNTSAPFNYNSVGINVTEIGSQVKIYPNPSASIVNVVAPFNTSIVLQNMEGKILMSGNNLNTINVSDISQGVYLLFVYDSKGNQIKIERLVIANR